MLMCTTLDLMYKYTSLLLKLRSMGQQHGYHKLEMHSLRPHPDLLNQTLHFNKTPREVYT